MSYSPKISVRPSPINGFGLFALAPLSKDELVTDYSDLPGQVCDGAQADVLYEQGQRRIMQVGEDRFFVADKAAESDPVFSKNHSCQPSCGMRGNYQVVAMRDIAPGEEITTDYAMNESTPDYSMPCSCGAPECRKVITGNDWQLPALQKRYQGYFSEYLAKKIGER